MASVREYAILYARKGGGSGGGGGTLGGGNALLSGAAHALDGPEHTAKGDVHSAWTLVAGGSIAPTPGDPPTGEIVTQVKTSAGAPTHTATRGTLCLVAPDERVYINVDGATAWVGIGAAAETPFDHGNMGATETIDVATNGTWHRGNLDVACAITVAGFTVDEGLVALVELTGTGAITWDADVDLGGDDGQPSASGYTAFILFSSSGDADIKLARVGGGGAALTVEDEGTPLATDATTLDFVGAGVTASGTGAEKTITIPGDAAHIADATDAHDASAVSFTPAGTIAATDVQAAIEEVASEAGTSGDKFVVDPGAPSYAGSGPTVTLTSVFGITSGGAPYYNAANVTSGEEAALMRDPASGTYFLRDYNF